MRIVNITKHAKQKIKKWGLWNLYKKQKNYFLQNPSHPSLDFIIYQDNKSKHKFPSFKINNQYRVKMIKHKDENTYTVIDADDLHRKQSKK